MKNELRSVKGGCAGLKLHRAGGSLAAQGESRVAQGKSWFVWCVRSLAQCERRLRGWVGLAVGEIGGRVVRPLPLSHRRSLLSSFT